ncbi:MAG: PD-(D/E)XK nuclease domain-containing protein, partial [Candidatus Methanomethylophilaceae archaeon]|nr:PD-(D/E)XK nuclease domain-containing protein [Candidatus Methanomethylophilaceae archaeon]
GNGRADIIMRPNRPGLPNIILEMKRFDSIGDLESDSSKAISQIEEKGYFRNMKGRTLLYGISFNGKSSRISMKEMTD